MSSQRSKGVIDKLVYLDLFSGNGLNKIEINNSKIFVCGSPILALLASHFMSDEMCDRYFDHMILIDKNISNSTLLSKRLERLLQELEIASRLNLSNTLETNPNITTITGDMTDNHFVDRLVTHLDKIWSNSRSIHIMMFIDPGSPQNLRMSSLKKLLSFPGDVIMLLHPGLFSQMVNKKRYKPETLQSMLDISIAESRQLLSKTYSPSRLGDYYVGKYKKAIQDIEIRKIITGSSRREVIKTASIKTIQSKYTLLYATRKTGGNHYMKWQTTFENFANKIGRLSDSGSHALSILTGNQGRIDSFFGI